MKGKSFKGSNRYSSIDCMRFALLSCPELYMTPKTTERKSDRMTADKTRCKQPPVPIQWQISRHFHLVRSPLPLSRTTLRMVSELPSWIIHSSSSSTHSNHSGDNNRDNNLQGLIKINQVDSAFD